MVKPAAPGIPYDWRIGTVYFKRLRQSYGFARAESFKHVEHVKPSYTAPFDVLKVDIVIRETVSQ